MTATPTSTPLRPRCSTTGRRRLRRGRRLDADGDGYTSWEEVGGPDCLDSDASVWTSGSTKAAAGLTCAEILSASPSSADGLYWVDPDGDGDTSDAWQAYCDMTRDGGGWTKVESALYPYWFSASSYTQVGSASDDNYTQLTDLDDFARAGVWTFRFEVGNRHLDHGRRVTGALHRVESAAQPLHRLHQRLGLHAD
ncbi:MAG: hypothetical protein IPO67_18615 [Deltaproteobacteria bacterium]|nr:hypothetical protein [Deltaproteobacteria bacterium]